jgi:hypothetical protein
MRQPHCKHCGVEITRRETGIGHGFCFVCASIYGPREVRRSPYEAVREMGCAEEMD